MSYYYNYFIGYRSGGKFFPLGPYDSFGKLRDVVSKSRSFASDLHKDFNPIPKEDYSEELLKEFTYKDYKGEDVTEEVKYLPIEYLTGESFVKSGYFLIKDVMQYEKSLKDDDIWFDGFYDFLTPTVYNAMLEHELKFGRPKPIKDEFGEECQPESVTDYMYYSYPDFHGKEYESLLIREASYMLKSSKLPTDAEIVVLETEG